MNPPLRGQREIDNLWAAIRAGKIDFVGTDDHVGSAINLAGRELSSEEFWSAESASPGIGVGTPLFLTEGLRRGIDLRDLSRLMSRGPARTFAIDDRKGAIAVGMDADLMLVDLKGRRTVEVGRPTSLNLTIADGLSLVGWPRMTVLRGQIVFEDDVLVAPPIGSVVVPSGQTGGADAASAGGTIA
jgi:dihydroorotase-like cyclic amidohydrolase